MYINASLINITCCTLKICNMFDYWMLDNYSGIQMKSSEQQHIYPGFQTDQENLQWPTVTRISSLPLQRPAKIPTFGIFVCIIFVEE